MSSRADMEKLTQQVAMLTEKLSVISDKVGVEDKPPTEKEIAKEEQKKAHEERKAAYKRDNNHNNALKYNFINKTPEEQAIRNVAQMLPAPHVDPVKRAIPPERPPIVLQAYYNQWKVTASNDIDGFPILMKVKVLGGDVSTQNGFDPALTDSAILLTVDPLGVESTGYVILNVAIDTETWLITSAVIEWAVNLLPSTEAQRYYPLAHVTISNNGTVTQIIQMQIGPVRFHKDTVAELLAGELNDTLIHDGMSWVPFNPPSSTGTWLHGFVDGVHTWVDTYECP